MQGEASDTSLDSLASTTASDVLIHSTSIHRTGSLRKEAAGGSRASDATDASQGLMDFLDIGMVASRCQNRSALSGVYSGRREPRQRDTSITGSHGSTRKSDQVIMQVPKMRTMAGEGQEVRQMSAVSSHKGDLQGSQTKRNNEETVCSQDGSTVQISVKRLREIPAPLQNFITKKRDPTYVPPALPANKYPAVRFTLVEETADAVGGSSVQKNVTPKNSKSPKVLVTKHFQDGNGTKKKTQEDFMQKNKDVQILQFTNGQKESLMAALNKRVQSGPMTKEVRVQLLQDASTSSKKCTGSAEEKAGHSEVQSATIAAATAAAIAATVPVLKAQSDLEVQMNSVSQLLSKLQETDRQLHKLTDQQIKIQSQPSERLYPQERVSELERQLSQLTEQRLQHLEKLQQQQLEMQSHFIRSAIKTSANPPESASMCTHVLSAVPKPQTLHQPLTAAAPTTSDKAAVLPVSETSKASKSPLETPAPRRFAPQPMCMDVQLPPKAVLGKENVKQAANGDKVPFLQQILGHDGTPLSKSSYSAHNPLISTKAGNQPFNDSLFQRGDITTRTNVGSSCSVQKADDVLQDLNSLKQEMQNLVQDAKQWKSQAEDFKLRIPSLMTSAPVFAPQPFRRSESMFEEDAERVLRDVQNKKKIIDDNLEAIIRAKDTASFYSILNALTTDGFDAEKHRIRKTVDSWITEIDSKIQDDLAREDIKKRKPEDRVQEPSLRRNAGSSKDVKMKGPARGVQRTTKPSAGVSAKAQPTGASLNKGGKPKVPQKVDESSATGEEALNRVYGTPVYQGHRSTLKKGPYLRFSSPSPKSKPRRPKVVETVKGVKVKSARTQADSPDTERPAISVKVPDFSVVKNYKPQYVFIPSAEPSTLSVPMEGHLMPTAIPLGKPQFIKEVPVPSAVIRTRPHPVVVNVSVPPQTPKAQPKQVKPNIAVVEVKSEKKEPPQLRIQVLPCVDIDSIVSDSPSSSQRTPSPDLVPPAPSPAQPDIQIPVNVETEEEILAMPGTSYQEPDFAEDDEENEAPYPVLEISGRGETNAPQHGGISFPPSVPPLQTRTDILDGIINRREALINRLISQVEKEVMSRVISEMNPANQSEAAPGTPVDPSLVRTYVEEDLAEIVATMLRERAARAVPSPLQEEPDVQPEPEEITPVPTPQTTPPASPLPSAREPSIVITPELSPQPSVEEPDVHQEEPEEPEERSLPTHVVTPTITPAPSPPRVATPTPVLSEEPEKPPVIQAPPPNPWGEMELPLEEENPHSVIEAVEYKDAAVMTVAVEEEPRSLISAASPEPTPLVSPKPRTPSPVPSPSVSAPSTDESSLTVTESDTTDKPISEGEIVYSYGQIAAARALAEGGLVYPNLVESLSSTLRDANDMEFDPPSEGQVIRGPHRGAHHDPVLSLLAKFNQDLVAPHEAFYHLESSGDNSSSGEISEGQRPRLTTAAEQVLVGHSTFLGMSSYTGQTAGQPLIRPSSPGQYTDVPGINRGDGDNLSSGPMSIRDLDAQLLLFHPKHPNNVYHLPAVPKDTSQVPGQSQKQHQPAPTRLIQVGVKSAEDLHQGTEETQEDTDRTLVEPSDYLTSTFSGEASRPTKNIPVTLPTMSKFDEEGKTSFVESDSSGADTF